MDAALQELQHHPDVQFHMLPLPLRKTHIILQEVYGSILIHNSPIRRAKARAKRVEKTQGRIQVPDGRSIKFGENKNKPICKKFNVGTC